MEEEVEVFLEKDHRPLTDDIQIEGGEKRGIYIKNVQKDSPVAKNLHLSEGDKLISATINFDDMKYDDAVRFLEISDKYMTELKLRKSSRGSPTSGTTTFDFESSETTVRGATTARSPRGSTSYTPHNHHCSPNSMSCRWCSASKCIGATSPYMDLSPSDEHYSIIYEKKIKPRLSSSGEVGYSATNQRGKTSTSPREVIGTTQKTTHIHSTAVHIRGQQSIGFIQKGIKTGDSDQMINDESSQKEKDLCEKEMQLSHVEQQRDGLKTTTINLSKLRSRTGDLKPSQIAAKTLECNKGFEANVKAKENVPDISFSTVREDIEVTSKHIDKIIRKKQVQLEDLKGSITSSTNSVISKKISTKTCEQVNIEAVAQEQKKDIKGLKFHMSTKDMKAPKISGPGNELKGENDVSLTSFEGSLEAPSVNGAAVTYYVDTEGPNVEMEANKGKIMRQKLKMPKFNVSFPKGKEPNIDFQKPNIDVSLPKVKVKVDTTKGDVNVDAPDVGIDGEGEKLSQPHMRMPKLKILGFKHEGKDLETDICVQKGDVTFKGPEIKGNIEVPEVDLKVEGQKGGFQGPKFHLPTTDIKAPNISTPEIDIHLPKLKGKADVSCPAIEGSLEAPSIDIEGSNVSLDGEDPDLDFEDLEGKIKKPKFNVSFPKGKGQDVDFQKPDVDISLPKGKVEMDTKAGINVDAPDVGIDGKGAKFNFPHMRMPKFKIPGFKHEGADLKTDISVKKGDVTFEGPDIKGNIEVPEVDLQVEGHEGGIKAPKFQLPSTDIKAPKMSRPEIDIHLPKLKGKADVSLPGIEGSLEAPSVSGAAVNYYADTEGPNVEMEASKGNIMKQKLQMPKFDVSFPKGKGPDMDVRKKDVNVSMPKVKVKMDMPKGDVNVDAPDVGINGKGAKFTLPHTKMPKIKIPGFKHKGADLETDISIQKEDVTFEGTEIKGNIEVPEVDLKVEGHEVGIQDPKFHLPTKDIKAPKISTPEIDVHLPKLKDKADVSYPGIEGSLEAPSTDIEESNVYLHTEGPNIEFEAPEGKIKKPKFQMPKFNVSFPNGKGPGVDFQKPVVDLSLPKGKVEMDTKAGTNEDATDVGIDGKGAKFSFTHMRMPKIKIPGFKHEGTDLETDISVQKGDVTFKGPEMKGNIEVPEVDLKVEGQKGGFQGTKFHLPTTDIKAPNISTPEIDIHLPKLKGKADVSCPGIEGSLEAPSIDIEGSNVSLDGESLDLDFKDLEGKIKKPKFNVSLTKGKGQDMDFQKPDVDVSLPKGKVEMDTKAGINVDAPDVGSDGKGAKFSVPHIRMPKFKIPGFKHEGADLKTDISDKKGDITFKEPESKGSIEVPEVDLKVEGHKAGIQRPKFHLPTTDIKAPKITTPEIDIHLPKLIGKADVSSPGIEGSLEAPSEGIKESNVSLHAEGPNIEFEAPEGKIKKPKFQMPKFNVSFPNGKGPGVDFQKPVVDLSLPKGKVEMDTKAGANVDAPDVGIDGKGAKFSFPHMSMPKIKIPGFKHEGADLETDISAKKGDVTFEGPEIKGNIEVPEVDLQVEGHEGGFQGPKFHLPTIGIKAPKILTPEIDIHLPKLKGKAEVSSPGIEGSLEAPSVSGAAVNYYVDTEGPNVEVEASKCNVMRQKLQMPKFNVSFPKGKGPDMDFLKPGVDVSLPKVKVKMNTPKGDINVDAPDINIDGKGEKFGQPHMRMPKIKIPGFKHEGADLETDISVQKGDVTFERPEIEGCIGVPEVDLKVVGHEGGIQGPKFHLPTTDIKAPKIPTPKIDTHLPKLKGKADVSWPGIEGSLEASSVDIEGPNGYFDTEVPHLDYETPDGKIKKPKFQMPKFNVSFPTGKGPDVDFQKTDVDMSLPKGKVKTDTKAGINVDAPDVGIDGKGAKFSIPHMRMPKFKIPGFKQNEPDIDIGLSLQEPDIDVKEPKLKGDIEDRDVDLDVEKGKSGIKTPTFHLPTLDIKAPKISAPDLDFDVNLPKFKSSAADIEGSVAGPAIDITRPKDNADVDVEGPQGKMMIPDIHMPKFGLSWPKGETPEADIDLSIERPDVEISMPKVKGKVDAPKGEIDIESPDIDVEGGGFKFKRPHFNMPKMNIPGFKREGPDLDADLSLEKPDLHLKGSKVKGDIEYPDIDLDVEGGKSGIKAPTFHLPTLDIKAPKISAPDLDFDVNFPKFKSSAPDIEASIAGPAIDITRPKVDADVGVEGPQGKMKIPEIHLQKSGLSWPKGETPAADIDLSIESADVDASLPEVKGKVDAPKGEIDVESPDSDVKGGGFKFKRPHFSLPKMNIPGFKREGPDLNVDLSLEKPDLHLKGPEVKRDIECPDIDLDVEGGKSGIKAPTFHLPTLDIKAPKISAPDLDFDVNFPKFKSSAPDIEGSVAGPAIDITRPKVDADVGVEGPQGKMKIPDIHLPKFGLSWPKGETADADIDLSIESPDVGASLPEVKGKVDAPKSELNVKSSDIDVEGGGFGIHRPHFKMPKMKIPGFKREGPDSHVDLSLQEPDVDIKGPKVKGDFKGPDIDLDVEGGKSGIKAPTFHLPTLDIKAPKISAPDLDFDVNFPKFKSSAPDIEGSVTGPAIDITRPKVDGDVDVEGSQGKIKIPDIHLPKFGLSWPKGETADADIDLSIERPDVDISMPKVKSKVDAPKGELHVKSPDIDAEGGGFDIHLPHFKMPKMKIPGIKREGTDLDFDLSLQEPDVDVKGPKVKGDIKGPDIDLDVEGGKSGIKAPTFHLPTLDIKAPTITGPDIDFDVNFPKFKGRAPDIKGSVDSPSLDLKGPKVDVERPDLKIEGTRHRVKIPKVNLPKFRRSWPKGETPEADIDLSIESPDVVASLPDVKGKVDAPKGEIDVESPDIDVKGGGFKFKRPHFNLPKMNIPGFKRQGTDFDVDLSHEKPDLHLKGPDVKGDIECPDIDLDVQEGKSGIKAPTFHLPTLDIKAPKISAPDLDFDVNFPKFKSSAPDIEGSVAGPAIDIKRPKDNADVDVEGPQGKIKIPDIHLPKFGFSWPKGETPDADIDLSIESADVDASLPGVKGKVDAPKGEIDVESPDIDVKGGGFKFKRPHFNVPKMNIPGFKREGPDLDVDLILEKPDLHLKGSKVKGDIEYPDIDLGVEGGKSGVKTPKLHLPTLDIKAPKITAPDIDFDVNFPKIKSHSPDIEGSVDGPSVDVKGPKVDVEGADMEIEGLQGGMKIPKFHLPKFGLSWPKGESTDADIDLSIERPDVDISMPKVKGKVDAPKGEIDIKSPDIDVEGGGFKFKRPHFNMPKMNIPGFKREGPDLDADLSLEKPDLHLKGSKVKGDIEYPDIDLDVQGGKSGIKAPTFHLPTLDIKAPKISAPDLDFDVNFPKFYSSAPDIEGSVAGPAIDIKRPKDNADVDVEGPQGKMKIPDIHLPKFGLSWPKGETPDADIDLSIESADVDASLPKVKGKVDAPKGEIDVESPNIDVKGGGFKFKRPHFNMPKMNIPRFKREGPDLDVDLILEKPDLHLKGSKVKGDIEYPDIDFGVEGGKSGVKTPKLHLPTLDIKAPKITAPDIDFDVNFPKIKSHSPDIEGSVDGPSVDVKGPKVDVEGADMEIEGLQGGMKIPKFHLPKFGLSWPKGESTDADIDLSIERPDVDISMPKVKGKVDAPKGEIDIKSPDIDVEGGGFKFKRPHFNMPKMNIPGFKREGPDLDADLSLEKPDLHLKGSKVKGDIEYPDIDLDVQGGKSGIKAPTFHLPTLDIKAPKISAPDLDFDVNFPKFKSSAPDIEGSVAGPAIDIKRPKDNADVDVEGPQGKMKIPDIHLPKFGLSWPKGETPDADIDLSIESADVDASLPKVKGKVDAPKGEIDVESPNIDVKGGGFKFKRPHFNMPKMNIPGFKREGPDLDVDLNLEKPDLHLKGSKVKGDIEYPDIDLGVEGGKSGLKTPKLHLPTLDIKAPKITAPDIDFDVNFPKIKSHSPDIEGSVDGPSVHVKGPKVDVEGADVDIEGLQGGMKIPKFHLPKFGLSWPKGESADADIDLSIERPDIDISMPKVKGKVDAPKGEIDIESPDIDVEGGGFKFKRPHFNMPKMNIPGFKHEGPDLDADLSLQKPDLHLKGSKVKGDIEYPDIDLGVEGGKSGVKTPKLHLPTLDIKAPKITAPDIDFDVNFPKIKSHSPDIEGSVDGPSVDVKGPKVDVEGADVDIEGLQGGMKIPKFHLPKFGLSWPKGESSDADIDLSIERPDIDISMPKVKGKVDAPKGEIDIESPDIDVEGGGFKFKRPHFNMPKMNIPGFKREGSDLDADLSLEKPDLHLKGSKVKGDIEYPDIDIDVEGGKSGIKTPTFHLPTLDIKAPKFTAPDIDFDVNFPKFKSSAPDIEGSMAGPAIDITRPKVDAGVGVEGPQGKMKIPDIHLPKFGLSWPKGATADADIDLSIESPDVGASLPEVKGKVDAPKSVLNAKSSDIDVEGGVFDIHLPHFKMPKMKIPGFKREGPDSHVNLSLQEPDVDVKGPKVKGDIKGPDIDLDVEGGKSGIKAPTFHLPTLDIKTPKISAPDLDFDVNFPKFKSSAPDIEGSVAGPAIDITRPKVYGDVDVEGSQGKIKIPDIHLPKFGLSWPKGETADADIDLSIERPDVDISMPKVKGKVDAPKGELHVKSPDIDVEGGGFGIHLPHFKMPKMKIPGIKREGPDLDVDLSLQEPDVDLKGPKVRGDIECPDVDINGEGHIGGINTPNLHIPRLDIKAPTLTGPDIDFDVNFPKFKSRAPDIKGSVDRPSLDLKGPKVDVERPDLKIEGTRRRMKIPKVNLPNFRRSWPKGETPEADIDLSIESPDVVASLPDVKGKADAPKGEIDVESPDIDVKGGGFKFKRPHFNLPKMNIPGFKRQGSDLDVDLSLEKPDLHLKGPDVKGDIECPDIDLDVQGGKSGIKAPTFHLPTLDIKAPKISAPDLDFDVNFPKFKSSAPDIEGSVAGPAIDIKRPKDNADVDVEGPQGKMKIPDIHLPKFGLSWPKGETPDADIDLSIESADVDASLPKVKGKVDAPKGEIDIESPDIDVEGGGFKFKRPHFNMPKMNIPGFKREGPDLDADLSFQKPDLHLKGSKVKGDIEYPDIDLGVEGGKSGLKTPKLHLPTLDIKAPKITAPDIDFDINFPKIKSHSRNIEGSVDGPSVDVKGPKVDVEGADVDIEGLQGGMKIPKFHLPKFGLSWPKGESADADIDLSIERPDIDISMPKVKGKVDAPKGEIDIESPDIDVEGGGFKFKRPHFNMPKMNIPGFKREGPDLDADLSFQKPDLHLKGSKVKGDIEYPDIDLGVEGGKSGLKTPKLHLPTLDIKAPKITAPDIDFDVNFPKIKSHSPDIEGSVDGPSVDVKGPKVDVEGADVDIEGLQGGMKIPKFHLPKFGLSWPKGESADADIDLSIERPDIDISMPKVKGKVDAPKGEIDIESPDIDVEGGGFKFKRPHFNMPKMNIPGFKREGPDLDADLSLEKPDLHLKGSKVKGDIEYPDIDIDVKGGKSGIKAPTFQLPTLDIKAPKLSAPDLDFDVNFPKFKSSAPDIEGSVAGPAIDITRPKVDGDVDVEGSQGKIKIPDIHLPKFGLSWPKGETADADIDLSIERPDVDMSMPKVKGKVDAPKGELHVKSPDIDVEGGGFDIHLPRFKMPKMKIPGFKREGPDLDVDLSLQGPDVDLKGPKVRGDIEGPDVDINGEGDKGGINTPNLHIPRLDIKAPTISGPDIDFDVNFPKFKSRNPDMKGSVDSPSLDLKVPKVDVERPDLKIEGTRRRMKIPKVNLPNFRGSWPKGETPDADIDLSIESADVDASLPEVKGKVDAPKGEVDVESPDIDVKGGGFKFKRPHFNLPKMNIPGFKREGPDLDVDLSLEKPDVHLKGPEVKGDIECPDIDLDVEGGKSGIKAPTFHLPTLDIKAPTISGPDIDFDVNFPKFKSRTPHIKGSVDSPSLDLKGPTVDVERPEIKIEGTRRRMKIPKVNLPNFRRSWPKGETPEADMDLNVEVPDVDASLPKVKGKVDAPKGEIDIESPDIDVEGGGFKFKRPHFNMPKMNIPGFKREGPDFDADLSLEKPDLHLKGSKVKGDIEYPDIDLGVEGGKSGVRTPKLHLPTLDIKAPKITAPDIDFDVNFPKIKSHSPDIEGSVDGPSVDVKGPKVDVEGADVDIEGLQGGIKIPKFHLPKFGLSWPKGESADADIDLSIERPDIDISMPKVKGKVDAPKGEIDIESPDIDVEGGGFKFKRPHFNMPKMNIPGFKREGPDLDADLILEKPELQLKGSKVKGDIEYPDIDIDVEGGKSGIKAPTFHLPTLDIKAPKITAPDIDFDVNFPKFKSSAPDIEGSVAGPAIDITRPKVDADIDVEGPQGKMKIPDIHLPKLGLSWPKGETADADIDLSIERPDVDMSMPKVKGKVDAPKGELHVKSPDIDVEGGGFDIHLPHFKMPKLRIPGFKREGPDLDVDLSLHETDVDLKGPKVRGDIEGPDVDINGEGQKRGINTPSLHFPTLDIKAPTISGPDIDFDVNFPKFKSRTPDIKGSVDSPSLDLKGPTVDVERPEIKIESTRRRMKIPKVNLPNFRRSWPKGETPEADMDLSVEVPDVDASLPVVKGKVDAPKGEIDVESPDIDVKGGGFKFKRPHFNLPKMNIPGFKREGPDLDVDLSLEKPDFNLKGPKVKGDIECPEIDLDVEGGKSGIKTPTFHLPTLDIKAPKISAPDLDFDVNFPKFKSSAADIEGSVAGPAIDITQPKDNADVDVKGPQGKMKIPDIHLPKFGFSWPKGETPDADIDLSIESPDIDASLPEVKGEVDGPKGEIDVESPDIDVKGGGFKFKRPHFNMPKMNIPGFKREGPDLDVDLNLEKPDLHLKGSKVKGDIEYPDIDLDVEGGKSGIKTPTLHLPALDIKAPKITAPDIDFDINFPKIKSHSRNIEGSVDGPSVDVKGPKVDVEGADVDIEGLQGGMKIPKFHLPKFGLSRPKGESADADIDLSIERPDVDISMPKVKGKLDAPKGEIDIESPDIDVEGGGFKFKRPHFNMPKMNIPGFKREGPDLDVDLNLEKPDLHLKGSKVEGDIEYPDIDLDVEGGKSGIKTPIFHLPTFDIKAPKLSAPDIDFDVNFPKFKSSAPDIEGSVAGPAVDITRPKVDADVDVEGPQGKMKIPDIHLPKLGLSWPQGETADADIDSSIESPDVDVSLPKVQGKVDAPKGELHVEPPNADLSIKGPKFKGDLEGHDFDVEAQSKHHSLDTPSLKMVGADADVNAAAHVDDLTLSKGKIKFPKFSIPKIGFSQAKEKTGKCSSPEAELIVEVPNLESEANGTKMSLPQINMPKLKFPGAKHQSLDFDVDSSLPKAEVEIKGSEIKCDIEGPEGNIVLGGQKESIKSPELQFPTLDIKGPRISTPDIDINFAKLKGDVDVAEHNKGSMEGPELHSKVPKAGINFEYPESKMDMPELKGDIEGPGVHKDIEVMKGGIENPTSQMPTLNIRGPTISATDINVDADLPKVRGDDTAEFIDPKCYLECPSLDIQAPNVELQGQKGKGKMPKISIPKFGFSKSKEKLPKADVNINIPNAGLAVSFPDEKHEVASPEGKANLDTSVDVKVPVVHIGAGSFEGNILPHDYQTRISPADSNIKPPVIDVEGLDTKLKVPKVQLPGFGISGKKTSRSTHSLEVKQAGVDFKEYVQSSASVDADLNLSQISDQGVNEHKKRFRFPKVGFKAPKRGVALQSESPSDAKIPLPSFGFSTPKSEERCSADISIKSPTLDVQQKDNSPTTDISQCKISSSESNLPRSELEMRMKSLKDNVQMQTDISKKEACSGDLELQDNELIRSMKQLKGEISDTMEAYAGMESTSSDTGFSATASYAIGGKKSTGSRENEPNLTNINSGSAELKSKSLEGKESISPPKGKSKFKFPGLHFGTSKKKASKDLDSELEISTESASFQYATPAMELEFPEVQHVSTSDSQQKS